MNELHAIVNKQKNLFAVTSAFVCLLKLIKSHLNVHGYSLFMFIHYMQNTSVPFWALFHCPEESPPEV